MALILNIKTKPFTIWLFSPPPPKVNSLKLALKVIICVTMWESIKIIPIIIIPIIPPYLRYEYSIRTQPVNLINDACNAPSVPVILLYYYINKIRSNFIKQNYTSLSNSNKLSLKSKKELILNQAQIETKWHWPK